MEIITVIAIIISLASVAGLFLLFYRTKSIRFRSELRNLMGTSDRDNQPHIAPVMERQSGPLSHDVEEESQVAQLARSYKNKAKGKNKLTLDQKFFQAGMFSPRKREMFKKSQMACFVGGALLTSLSLLYYLNDGLYFLFGLILGGALGYQAPQSWLDRAIKQRTEEIMFYLPLVVEQIAIGVSGSLDVGPCMEKVVTMADERDSHNAVTELLLQTQYYISSGVSMYDALTEIGKMSGSNDLKHVFMSLAQVARHGGEITRQLQELADAVSSQRETKIEEKIKKLELEATGPVGLVFLGFMIILMVGFGLQIKGAFS